MDCESPIQPGENVSFTLHRPLDSSSQGVSQKYNIDLVPGRSSEELLVTLAKPAFDVASLRCKALEEQSGREIVTLSTGRNQDLEMLKFLNVAESSSNRDRQNMIEGTRSNAAVSASIAVSDLLISASEGKISCSIAAHGAIWARPGTTCNARFGDPATSHPFNNGAPWATKPKNPHRRVLNDPRAHGPFTGLMDGAAFSHGTHAINRSQHP